MVGQIIFVRNDLSRSLKYFIMDNKNKKLFPQRLWDLIHDRRYNHFLRWSEDGQRVYLDRNDFEEQYLRTPNNQFHTQKAISFVRQMNMYGFKKVDDCHYENDNFKRDCHHLIKNMVRRNSNRPHLMTSTGEEIEQLIGGSSGGMHQQQLLVDRRTDEGRPSFESARSEMCRSLMSVDRPTNLLDVDRFIPDLGERQGPQDLSSRSNNQEDMRALYQQLAALNQISRTGQDSDPSNIRIPGLDPTSAGISCSNGYIPNIAQSSLASTLYQRMTVMTDKLRSADQQDQSRFLITGLDQPVVPSIAAQLGANMMAHVGQQQNLASNTGSSQMIVNMLNSVGQSAATQEILRQTLIRSLIQLKLAQVPQNFESELMRNMCVSEDQQMRPSCSLQSMSLSDPMMRLEQMAGSSSSSTSPSGCGAGAPRQSFDAAYGLTGNSSMSFDSNTLGRRDKVMLIDDGTDDSDDSVNACVVDCDDNPVNLFALNGASRGSFTMGAANLSQQSSASAGTSPDHRMNHRQERMNLISKNTRSV